MSLAVLNKILRKILSLVLNCEKKRDRKNRKAYQRAGKENSRIDSPAKVDVKHSKETFPDPWYN